MLNRVILMGRITQDLEVRQTPNGVSALTFNVAVDRNFKDQNGQYQSDFITCVAWRQTAEFIGRYFGKGRMIALEGTLRSRTYEDKNGTKHYVTEVYVDNASFTGEKANQGGGNYSNNYGNGGFNGGNNSYGGNGGFNGGNQNNFGGDQNNFGGNNQAPANDALNIGDLSEFEDVISDDGVPF